MTEIGENAFNSCKGLTQIKLPSSVQTIGSGAFAGCENLQYVEIPESVTYIGSSAFATCKNLVIDVFDTANRSIGSGAFNGVSIGEVIISESYTAHGYNPEVFYKANVGTVSFEEGISKIPTRALAGCESITELNIPDTVTEIGDDAFVSCDNIVLVTKAGSATEAYAIKKGILYKLK